jgi:hypothetical protein
MRLFTQILEPPSRCIAVDSILQQELGSPDQDRSSFDSAGNSFTGYDAHLRAVCQVQAFGRGRPHERSRQGVFAATFQTGGRAQKIIH